MKAIEKEELEKREKLLATIEKHPLTAQIKAEEAAAILATRKEAAEKIEVLQEKRAAILPGLQKNLAEKEAKVLTAKAEFQAASDELQAARYALASKNHNIEIGINQQKEILISTADDQIDEAILFFQKELDRLRTPGRIDRTNVEVKKNIFTWKKEIREESNREAVLAAMRYCQAAIKALSEEMKLSPELNLSGIEALKAGVPSIGEYREISGTKPFEKINTDPRSLEPSDSESKWVFNKLTEKVDELLHKPAKRDGGGPMATGQIRTAIFPSPSQIERRPGGTCKIS